MEEERCEDEKGGAYWGSVSGPTGQSWCVMRNNGSMARQFSFPFWLLTTSPVPARGGTSHQAYLSLRVWSWGALVVRRPPRAPTGLTPLQGRTRHRFSNTNHDEQEVGNPLSSSSLFSRKQTLEFRTLTRPEKDRESRGTRNQHPTWHLKPAKKVPQATWLITARICQQCKCPSIWDWWGKLGNIPRKEH